MQAWQAGKTGRQTGFIHETPPSASLAVFFCLLEKFF